MSNSGAWGLWPLAMPEEEFGGMLFKTCVAIMESEAFAKFEDKGSVFTIFAEVVKKFQVLLL